MARLLQDNVESPFLIRVLLHGKQDGSSSFGMLRGAQVDREYGACDVQCAQMLFADWRGSIQGIPRSVSPSSHHVEDLKDGAEALTALGLWMLSPVSKVQVKVQEKMFDYVLKLQCLRH